MNTIETTATTVARTKKQLFRLEVFERKTKAGDKIGTKYQYYDDADKYNLEVACEQFIKYQKEKYESVMQWEDIEGLFEKIKDYANNQDKFNIEKCLDKLNAIYDDDWETVGAYFDGGNIEKLCEMPSNEDIEYYLAICHDKNADMYNNSLMYWCYDVYCYELCIKYVQIEEEEEEDNN